MSALAPGRVAYVNYGQGEWHQRLVLGHVQGTNYVVMTPDHDIFVEQLDASNPDLEGFRVQAIGGGHPVGIPPAQVYAFGPLTAEERSQILSEGRDIVDQERGALGLPALPVPAAAEGGPPGVPPPRDAAPPGVAPLGAPGLPPPAGGLQAADAAAHVAFPVLPIAAPVGPAAAAAVPALPAVWPGYPAAAAVPLAQPAPAATGPPAVLPLPPPRPAGPTGAWVLDEPSESLEVGTEFSLPAGAAVLSDASGGRRALVRIGPEVLTLRFLNPGHDIQAWARERKAFLGMDARTLPPVRNL
jgi:hypothetical protein